ncbi:MAG: toxin-antitoxin system HicB family antitoxin [Armatimonadetes bacterium CG06_land_8_20_14_3_00_66_21]|nr:MAG: toxin-antitoxin system HicB family antitoxin [Armatimonadetes bacterium CG06_land_8_20_14_3_00_66_21]
MIEYEGYLGAVEFDPETDSFHGTVVNTNDVITFYGSSVTELRAAMRESLKEYFAFCQEQDREPEQPFSGNLMIHTSPELHRRVALAAARRQVSVGGFIEGVLDEVLAA